MSKKRGLKNMLGGVSYKLSTIHNVKKRPFFYYVLLCFFVTNLSFIGSLFLTIFGIIFITYWLLIRYNPKKMR